MTEVIRDAARPIRLYRLAAGISMSALFALGIAPASAQSRSGQQRAIDIAVTDLGLPGTFRALINDRGLVFGTDGSTGANFALDTRTGAFDGSVPGFDIFDINKRGEVVGIFDAPRSDGGTQGALWTREGGRRLSSTFLARGINKRGDMAGNCIVGIDQVGPPCVLIRGAHDDLGSGVIHVIDVDTAFAALFAINDHRVAVGNIFNADGSQRAFAWSFTDGVRFLDAPPATSSSATAINNHGLIAGAIQGGDVSRPAVWFAGSGRTAATLPALNGLALAINDHGLLLVNAFNGQSGKFEYHVWAPTRHVVAVLPPAHPTATGVVASDINNRGEIIGSEYYATPDGVVLSTELIMWQIAIRGAHQ
jgi:uncharacterized membrane protein